MLTQEQELAVKSVGQNVLVAAGAGSGKTHVLVERYVEILRNNPETGLSNIIAVTFTRKAAAEMRSRLKSKFLQLSLDAGEKAQGLDRRWHEAMLEVDGAKIGTIHSLCESILKLFSADCGIDPQFSMLDELTTKELLSQAIEGAIRDIVLSQSEVGESAEAQTSSHQHELFVLNVLDFDKLKSLLESMLRSSMQINETLAIVDRAYLLTGKIALESLRDFASRLLDEVKRQRLRELLQSEKLKRLLQEAASNAIAKDSDAMEQNRRLVLSCFADASKRLTPSASGLAVSSQEIDQCWRLIGEAASINMRGGGRGDDVKAVKEILKELKALCQDFIEKFEPSFNTFDEEGFEGILGIVSLYRMALERYQSAKAELNSVDYNDLIAMTIEALSAPQSRARAFFAERLHALLVDEFQDTNDLQARLLSLLAGDSTRIFLIGDDKQSIYKFQGADVATFNKWRDALRQGLPALKGESLVTKLTASFRSHPHVVGFVNAVFEKVFDSDPAILSYVASFEALNAARPLDESNASENHVDIVRFVEDEEYPGDKAQFEAQMVAQWIKHKIASGSEIEEKSGARRTLNFGDFAVLVQRNGDFQHFEKVFARHNIPFVVFGGSGFLRRQEVLDFENLLRFLDNPQETGHALLAVLRSPFCSLTDDLIHSLADGTRQPLWQKLLAKSEERPDLYGQTVRLLKRLIEDAALLPLDELLHKIVADTAFDLALLAAPDGRQRSRNIWKLLQMTAECDHISAGEFADRLAKMRQLGVRESEAPLDGGDSVKIMTIHASKGLEFPAVALPCLSGGRVALLDKCIYHPYYGIALNTAREDKNDKPGWFKLAAFLNEEMEWEEKKRLLYVAMTRARDYLALFVKEGGRNVKNYRTMLQPILFGADIPPAQGLLAASLNFRGQDQPFNTYLANDYLGQYDWRSGELFASQVGIQDEIKSQAMLLPTMSRTAKDPEVDTLGLTRITARGRRADIAIDEGFDRELISSNFLGTFFHQLMENLPARTRPDEDFLRRYVSDVAFGQSFHMAHGPVLERLLQEGLKLLDTYYESRLFELVQSSPRLFKEMTYLIDSYGEEYKKRQPDLVFEGADGLWYIVDYKTDHLEAGPELQARRHKEQLQSYARDLEALTGFVFAPYVYFARPGILYPV
ncbi:MAG: UvrD-helicase domain-containing protein [Candidatus Obscuribacter phosphatis]|uniref:DNA 3'-5' helicase n=1 Tax=Candidatus Obscuribacter phosphatis TaxID=1906157 RepID=A0A8J7PNM4_9BACT|nr:UvrD-helicase domain-containing protein [Candidatus Obscuribacter phosphatis]